jgi:hypothetical protein
MKKIFFVFFTALISISCLSDVNFTPQNIQPILVGKGSLMGSEGISPQNTVVNNNIDWNNLLNLIDENRIQLYFSEMEVDFSTYQLLCVFGQVYNNSGHETTISSIVENENNIIVTIQLDYTPSITAITEQPFHVIKMPTSPKPVVFEILP